MSGKRRLCDHCGEYVSKSTFFEHKKIAQAQWTVDFRSDVDSFQDGKCVRQCAWLCSSTLIFNIFNTDLSCVQESVETTPRTPTSSTSEESLAEGNSTCSESSEPAEVINSF